MSKSIITKTVAVILLLAMVALAITQLNGENELKLKNDIKLETTRTKLEIKRQKFEEINKELEQTKDSDKQKTDRLNELEKEVEKLEKDLQAKLKAQEAEKQRIASANPLRTQTAAASPQNGSGSCALAHNYDWPKNIAHQICILESGGNPNAANWSDNHTSWAGCMGSFGLMQINCSHGQVYDGKRNMDIAYSMYKSWGNNFRAWTTCKKVSGCY